jgi:signal transduction histidine kinase
MKWFLPLSISSVVLFAIAFWVDRGDDKMHSAEAAARQVSERLFARNNELTEESILIRGDTLVSWSPLKNHFYLIDGTTLVKWNRSDFVIKPSELLATLDSSLVQLQRSRVFIRKWKLSSRGVLVGLIPISTDHRIVNQYIQPWTNPQVVPEGVNILDAIDPGGEPVYFNNKILFRVAASSNAVNPDSFLWAIAGLFFYAAFVFAVVHYWHWQKRYLLAFVFLFGLLAAMRVMMVEFSFPSRWVNSDFFNPAFFASSSFNSSLMDFFLNSLIVAISCWYLFQIHARLSFHHRLQPKNVAYRIILAAAFLTFAFFSFLFPYLFVEGIFHDSKISFDLSENVTFDGMRLLVVASVILGCASAFFFLHVWIRWAIHLADRSLWFVISLCLAILTFTIYFIFSEHNYWITLSLGTIYILYSYYSRFYKELHSITFKSIPFLLVPVILFSLQIALASRLFSEERQARAMHRFASNTLDRDVLGEYLLNDIVKEISRDPFIQSVMANPLLPKTGVREKIRDQYLTSYFDRYHIRMALFKGDGLPTDSMTSADLASSVKSYVATASQTPYKDIYFVDNAQSQSFIHYLAVVKLPPESGYIILNLSLKHVIPKLTLPELVVDNRFAMASGSNDFSFAFYHNQSLLGSFGSYNFDREINPTDYTTQKDEMIHRNGYSMISILDENNRRIVVATASYSGFMVLANFSFFFILGITLLFTMMVAFILIGLRQGISVSYTARIQSFAYLAFILPLVAVSFMALRMINISNQNQVLESNLERGNAISSEVSELMSVKRPSTENVIRNYAIEMARTFSMDLNIYDAGGILKATSSPEVVEEGLISNLVNREAWENIVEKRLNACQGQGKIGNLDYASLFFPVRSNLNGNVIGILELPFFRLDSFVVRSKVNVLSNILVIFTGVFLLFALLTTASIHSFTWPFRMMAKTLKSTRIGGNELIKWNSSDEFGLMVREYNQMVLNLERSKQALEKSERESAWREIAQQVAHEIKNPLTPIKLTLQQLEQSLPNGLDAQRVERSVKTLLTQVETLNEIATAFSSFAKMPLPNMQSVDVSKVLNEIIALLKTQPNRHVELLSKTSCWVKADPKLLSGIFSNLVLNAFQSRPEDEPVAVKILVECEGELCTISFADNGSGIPEELREKIFIPHFTTKQSGSGLGLAIAKQAVESMGGNIWFESKPGEGSSFFIALQKG